MCLHDVLIARMLLSKMTVAEQHGVTPDITAECVHCMGFAGAWRTPEEDEGNTRCSVVWFAIHLLSGSLRVSRKLGSSLRGRA